MHFIQSFAQYCYKFNFIRLNTCMILFTLGLSFNFALHAKCNVSCQDRNVRLAIALQSKFLRAVKHKRTKKFTEMIEENFQGLDSDGEFNRKETLVKLQTSQIDFFGINGPVATRLGDLLVFTFELSIVGTGLASGKVMTVWKKKDSSWKLIGQSGIPFVPNLPDAE